MNDQSSQHSYTSTAQVLHWLIAGLIVVQYVLAELAEGADDAGRLVAQLALLANHKSVGMTILGLAMVRLGWRLGHPPPSLPSAMPGWQRRISGLTHGLIYVAIFAIPLSGWLMSSASAYSVSWFNLFAFPDLVAPSERLAEIFHEIHHLATEALFILVLLHAAAALKHHFLDKDTVLKRMTSIPALIVFAAALLASGATLIPTTAKGSSASAQPTAQFSEAVEKVKAEAVDTEPDDTDALDAALAVAAREETSAAMAPAAPAGSSWQINYDESEIGFTGDQAGAPFTGRFDTWDAEINFDLDDPERASARVSVELASVNSLDADRDDTARGSDWFDVENTPRATFTTDQIEALPGAGQFSAQGSLTIGQITAQVTLALTAEQSGAQITLTGQTALRRTEKFNLGRGDWQDTDWVGEVIDVEFNVAATLVE